MRIPKYLTLILYGYKINIAKRWHIKNYNIKYFLTESLNSQQAEMWQKTAKQQTKKYCILLFFIKIKTPIASTTTHENHKFNNHMYITIYQISKTFP